MENIFYEPKNNKFKIEENEGNHFSLNTKQMEK